MANSRSRRGLARHLALCIVAVTTFILPSASCAAPLECKSKTLPNGVRLIVCPDPALSLTAIDVWVRAGAAMQKPEEQGAAHMLEHLLFKGTTTRGPGQIDLEMENVGATLNASTSRDWAHFDTTVATPYLDKAIDVLADVITSPAFKPAQVATEANVMRNELAGRQTDPVAVLDEALAESLFGSHAYAYSVYGKATDFEKLKPETLSAFHKRCYVGSAINVVIVGNVDAETTFAKLATSFGQVHAGDANPWPAPAAAPAAASTIDLDSGPGDSKWLGYAFLGPSMDHPEEVWAVDVLSCLLVRRGGGRLQEALVDKGKIAAAVDAGFLTQRLPAMIKLGLAAVDGKLDECDEAVEHEIFHLKSEPIPDAELEHAKRYLLGTYAFEVETASGLASSIGFYSIISDFKDAMSYTGNIRKVTAADVQAAARKYLDLERCVKVRLVK